MKQATATLPRLVTRKLGEPDEHGKQQFAIENDVSWFASNARELAFRDHYVHLSGYVGKHNPNVFAAAPALLEAAAAALRYDQAIRACAGNPARMSSFCTVEGDDLDTLYADWIDKARKAHAHAAGSAP